MLKKNRKDKRVPQSRGRVLHKQIFYTERDRGLAAVAKEWSK